MVFEADHEALPPRGKSKKAKDTIAERVATVWESASHCHFNRDFRFNSQSTSMQFTTRPTIGGRAWITIKLAKAEQEKALVLWSNTSLGILMHWWHVNKQQSGRGMSGVNTLPALPVLDVTKLKAAQLKKAVKLFDDFKETELRPLHEMATDPARRELDERFATDVLGLDGSITAPGGPLDLLRQKLASEPSVRGGK